MLMGRTIKVKLLAVRLTDRESLSIIIGTIHMKEIGLRIFHMGQENKNGETVFIMKVISWMGRKRGMENM